MNISDNSNNKLEKSQKNSSEESNYQLEVSKNIEDMNALFEDDDPKKILEDGTWFTKVLHKALNDTQNIDAEYFKKKYVGLDTENIAKRIISNTSTKTAIAGATAATIVTGSELALKRTKGTSIATMGATMIGEFASITYLQIKMVSELSILYNAELDKDDPEDLLTIFWLTLGINKWEEISNVAMKFSNRSGNYLGRKALRHFNITKLLQEGAKKFGGVQLARKITERGILKLVVPGINIVVAATINKFFTKNLGNQAITMFQNRTLALAKLENLKDANRELQLLVIPLIFFSGIQGIKKNNKAIEMQNITYKHLKTSEDEDAKINKQISYSPSEFIDILRTIEDKKVRSTYIEIATLSHNLSNSKETKLLDEIIAALTIKQV